MVEGCIFRFCELSVEVTRDIKNITVLCCSTSFFFLRYNFRTKEVVNTGVAFEEEAAISC